MTDNRAKAMTPLPSEKLEELKALLAKATPGPWEEDALWNNASDTEYRDSSVNAPHPLRPEANAIVVCDTLNAHFGFSPEDRSANMDLICALRNTAEALIAEIEAGRRAWQPIKTAPKDGSQIYGYDIDGRQVCMRWHPQLKPHHDKAGWFETHIRIYPTHWRPLFAAPRQAIITGDKDG